MSIVRPYPLRFRPIPSGRRAQPLTSARGSGSTTMAGHRLHLTFWYNLAAVALLLALLHGPLAEAQPLPWQLCNATAGNYTEGSAYQANVRALASALPANASSSRALFAEGAAGTAPDKVYAIALCRGDTNASSCAACLAAAFDTAQQLCAFNRRATLFNDPCILRYSDQDILANVTDNRGMFVAWNYNNVSTGRMAVFDATSGQLVNTSGDYASAVYDAFSGMLVNATADYAAKDSCTPDMSEADCRSCLGDIIRRMMPKYFVGKPGGRVFGVRCNFRFEAYEFFSGRPLLQLSGLPPSPPPPGLSAPSGLPPSPPGLRPAASGNINNREGELLLDRCVLLWLALTIKRTSKIAPPLLVLRPASPGNYRDARFDVGLWGSH
ncbi:cysteine-rich receptor-like protein kinase 10 isoform X1 [Oryza sativa Japonica Group]|uniref:cysteine-rich receptor-like protein kinase 10 isoform X1 n=1 Tax=Oryza sativa subsp. japonica TaxID=39947 RepID=UPI00339C0D55